MDTSDAAAPAVPALTSSAFSSVFQAIGGLRNRRALVALLSCLVAGVVVAMLLGLLGGFGRVLAALVWIVAVGTGVNAAGVILMDQARGVAPRRLSDALVYGLMCIPKLILLGLCLLLVAITVFIVIALVLLICKIPYLGPLVFVVAFPVSVLVAGLTFFGLLVGSVLALPAIWEGLTVTRAIAQALAIARTRGVEALLLLVMLWLLCLFVGFIVFGVLGSGLMPTVGLSAAILGAGAAGVESLAGVINGYGGGGYVIAGAIGLGVLWALATTLLGQVWLLGLAIVYLRVTEGLDPGATEAALLRGLEDAKRRTAELGEMARAKAAAAAAAARERDARESRPAPVADPAPSMTPTMAAAPTPAAPMPAAPMPAPPMAAAPPAPLAPTVGPTLAPRATAMSCPSCGAACTTDDVFCGVCGQRLK